MRKYERYVQAAGHSPGTIRLRRHYLMALKAQHPGLTLLDLTVEQLTDFLACPTWSAETRKSARTALLSFYSWAYESGLIGHNPAKRLPPIRVPSGKPRPTPESVFRQALAGADKRGRLMLLLAGYMGLRRGEIAKVRTEDVSANGLRITGKGGVVRLVPVHPLVCLEVETVEPGFLFPGQIDGHLSPGHVGVLLKRLLGPGWSGHTLRHKFASGFFNASKDLLLTQQMLGHSKPETTARYVLVDRSAAADIVANL